ncbi:MAG: hypothetical protein ABSE18_04460 [Minisyncoccia bacterium]|jgi:hypothetical protein
MGYRETKKKARTFYSNMKPAIPPRLEKTVFFNNIGFRHLIWKGGKHRPKSEQTRRFALLPHVEKIISNPDATVLRKVKHYRPVRAEFWIFKERVGKMMITVVIRRIGNGKRHFFSVY